MSGGRYNHGSGADGAAGMLTGAWYFPDRQIPDLDAVIEALSTRMELAVKCIHDDGGALLRADVPMIREILLFWDPRPDRIEVHCPVPGHLFLWVQLNAVMEDFGGRIGETVSPWRSELDKGGLDRPWTELTKRQRFILRLPTIGRWRPLDFLALRDGWEGLPWLNSPPARPSAPARPKRGKDR